MDKLQNRSSMKKVSKLSNQMRRKKRKCMKMGMDPGSASPEMSELETFGFEPGPGFTLKDFKKYFVIYFPLFISSVDCNFNTLSYVTPGVY